MSVSREAAAPIVRRRKVAFRAWMPLTMMVGLMLLMGAYTANKDSAFLSEFNLNGVFIATIPLALAAIGQTNALMVRAFDISVGALMTFCVVIASYTIPAGQPWYVLLPGALAVIACGLGVGAFNVFLVKVLGLSSIIATLATYSILQGICLWLRPVSAGNINSGFVNAMLKSGPYIPYAFIGLVVAAILADLWLYRTTSGLTARAVGFDETSAGRLGARVGLLFMRALMLTALAAAVGSFFLSAQVGVGDPRVGLGFTLQSIAAAVLGGAALAGGRGSFVGAVIGALFLSVVINMLPFLGWPSSRGMIAVGGLTLLALLIYQAPEIVRRIQGAIADFRTSRTGARVAPHA